MKKSTLGKAARRRWDALVQAEGPAIGLSDCRVFLENKLVNDIFYEGLFRGVPCIVKCSSRAPESIANEYEMSRRLAAVDPGVCAEAFAKWTSPDGRRAFVVTRRLPGPSLSDLIARGAGDGEVASAMADMLRIARALRSAGIVWRDVIPDNFIKDEDGHYRLIDAQFAIDRHDFREAPYLLRHWVYRTMVFAHHPMMAGRGWNDVAMMLFYVWNLSDSPRARALCEELRSMTKASAFSVEYGRLDEWRMRWLLVRLCVARMFRRSDRTSALDTRIARARAFLKRDCGLWESILYGNFDKGKKQ